jgi:hypothetical protein
VLVLRGLGDGTFQQPGVVVSHVPQPRGLAAADADLDGRPDLVVAEMRDAGDSLRVLLNHTYGVGSHFLDLGARARREQRLPDPSSRAARSSRVSPSRSSSRAARRRASRTTSSGSPR